MGRYDEVIYEIEDHVATITMNRPHTLNAVGGPMAEELPDALLRADDDNDVRVVVLTGTGRSFCSGADLKGTVGPRLEKGWTADKGLSTAAQYMASRTLPEGMQRNQWLLAYPFANLTRILDGYRTPIIAAVNGFCYGGGLLLALAADIRIAADTATFCSIFSKRGVTFEASTSYYLPKVVGKEWALRMQYTGEPVDAELAYQIGLCSEVVPADMLAKRVKEFATEIATNRPAYALALSKLQVKKGTSANDPEIMGMLEAYALAQLQRGHDYYEGEQAFVDKRAPQFEGY